jgi:DNA primase
MACDLGGWTDWKMFRQLWWNHQGRIGVDFSFHCLASKRGITGGPRCCTFQRSCRLSLPQDFDLKERVRSAVDIVDVVGATIELQPQGRNFVGRCPWHNDRRPSMTVNQERQTWKCWPCDIGGDVFSFIMRRDGVDFPTALKSLAETAGIPIEQYQRGKKAKPGSAEDRATLLSAVKRVSDAYFEQLESGNSADAQLARDYLASRGINDESRRRFRIGFAPDQWSFAVDLLAKHGISGEVAYAAGVASNRSGGGHVDMFRGRLMFPIHDMQGRPIALGGRVIPAIAQRHGDRVGGKYINGRETLLFRKSQQLYGLDLARDAIRRQGEVLVMEGYTDVVATRQAGIEPVVAVLGTALGEQHVNILRRLAQRVVLVLDGDAAGQNRADEILELFVRADVDLRVLTLPEGSDPADFVTERGPEQLQQLVNEAPDALDHKLRRLTAGVDVVHDTHAVTSAVDTLLKIAAKAPDGLRIDQLLQRMSRTFEFKLERLERRLEHFREQGSRPSLRPQSSTRRPSGRPRAVEPPQAVSRPAQARLEDPNVALSQVASEVDWDSVSAHGAMESTSSAGRSGSYAGSVTLQPLTGIDRELFETLIEDPDLAAMAVEAIDPDWFTSNTGKMLLSAYQDLELEGHSLDVSSVLLLVENESLKNQIVTLQQRIADRVDSRPESAAQRYAAIMSRYRDRAFVVQQKRQIEKLQSAELHEEEEVELLKAMIETQRARHRTEST